MGWIRSHSFCRQSEQEANRSVNGSFGKADIWVIWITMILTAFSNVPLCRILLFQVTWNRAYPPGYRESSQRDSKYIMRITTQPSALKWRAWRFRKTIGADTHPLWPNISMSAVLSWFMAISGAKLIWRVQVLLLKSRPNSLTSSGQL